MDKSLLKGLILGGVAATCVAALAGYDAVENRSAYAQVLSVQPLTKSVRTPHKNCWNETVTRQAPTKDPDQVAGTVVGALVGGVLGHQVGGGRGKTVATVAGAAAGGYAGNKIEEKMQAGDTYQSSQRRCATTYDTAQQPDGYEVHYKLQGREGTVRMDHDPGERIPVKNGELVLTSPSTASS
jgi:uncharacterized protein YcfJ